MLCNFFLEVDTEGTGMECATAEKGLKEELETPNSVGSIESQTGDKIRQEPKANSKDTVEKEVLFSPPAKTADRCALLRKC